MMEILGVVQGIDYLNVGDVRYGSVKRVASAAGEGGVVIHSVHQCLPRLRLAQLNSPTEEVWEAQRRALKARSLNSPDSTSRRLTSLPVKMNNPAQTLRAGAMLDYQCTGLVCRRCKIRARDRCPQRGPIAPLHNQRGFKDYKLGAPWTISRPAKPDSRRPTAQPR